MTHTHENIALVEVPEGAKGFRTEMSGRWLSFYVMTGEKKAFPEQRDLLLPPGSWRFVCLSTEMTEEKAREVVAWYGNGDGSIDETGVGDVFYCYDGSDFCFDTALESFASLLTALGCDPSRTYAVCVKND